MFKLDFIKEEHKKILVFIGALQLVFLILKLVGVFTWPWLVVLLPVLISLALLIVYLTLVFLLG